jgi:hypothetical protein
MPQLRSHTEGDSEEVCVDCRILCMSRPILTVFCRSRGG